MDFEAAYRKALRRLSNNKAIGLDEIPDIHAKLCDSETPSRAMNREGRLMVLSRHRSVRSLRDLTVDLAKNKDIDSYEKGRVTEKIVWVLPRVVQWGS